MARSSIALLALLVSCALACQNGWLDEDSVCNCLAGWTGTDCDEAGCRTGTCQNGGWCSYENGSAGECVCAMGWSGTTCETVDNTPGPCNDNGWVNEDSECVCFNGYTGVECADAGCQDTTCLNSGWCSYEGSSAGICVCQVGWMGTDCGTEDPTGGVDANCVNGWYSGTDCVCLNGWTGDACDTEGCQDGNTCMNGWCSYETGPAGSCVCTGGYTGTTCETAPAPSADPTPGYNDPFAGWVSAVDYISSQHCGMVCNHNPPALYCAGTEGAMAELCVPE